MSDTAAPAQGEEELLAARSEFPTCEKAVHLMSHTFGPVPRAARELANRYIDEWETETIHVWDKWYPALLEFGNIWSRLLNVESGTVIPVANCTAAEVIIASSFDYRASERRKIVYDDLVFPSIHYVWSEQERNGAEICVVKSDGINPPTEKLLEAIDERTLIVPISHVMFRGGAMYDAKRIIDKAHSVGALVFLDVYQSAGIVPLDLGAWGCDMASGGALKWMCGGPGAGFLYVRKEVLDRLRPTATGWFGHAEPFTFEMGRMRYGEGSMRFIGGVPAIPSIYTARAGLEIIQRLGVDRIRKKSLRQTRLLRAALLERGLDVRTPADEASHAGFLTVEFPNAKAVSAELVNRHFLQDYRAGGGMRISPHFFTTDGEIAAFLEELDKVRATMPSAK
jgi:kynureninase